MKKIAILTGAGISAESGIRTFRDADGLWEGHDIKEVASPEGWNKNKSLVLDFYNKRRQQLKQVEPNAAHYALTRLDEQYETIVITQNVDDLHERAGSSNIIHLHGALRSIRPEDNQGSIKYWTEDINIGDTDDRGVQYRPHIVWFGEDVPMITSAMNEVASADILIIVGTSMQVYPAAGLVRYMRPQGMIYYIDPNPHISYELNQSVNLEVITEKATIGLPLIVEQLLKKANNE